MSLNSQHCLTILRALTVAEKLCFIRWVVTECQDSWRRIDPATRHDICKATGILVCDKCHQVVAHLFTDCDSQFYTMHLCEECAEYCETCRLHYDPDVSEHTHEEEEGEEGEDDDTS